MEKLRQKVLFFLLCYYQRALLAIGDVRQYLGSLLMWLFSVDGQQLVPNHKYR